jgi:hypothetical protein
VRYGDDNGARQFFPDSLLNLWNMFSIVDILEKSKTNLIIETCVDLRRCLVHNDYVGSAENRPSHSD